MLDLTEEELILIGSGEPIKAIKMLRERTGMGLKESLATVNEEGLKAGLFIDEPYESNVRRLRIEGKETPATSPLFTDTPETMYLMPWVNFYYLRQKVPSMLPPPGVDPIKAVEALKKVRDIVNNNSFKDKVVRVRHILNDFWRAFI